jgi:hypothetical protein
MISSDPETGPRTRTTYAPPVRVEDHPASNVGWRTRAGLTDPTVLAAQVRLRTAGFGPDASYDAFFRP